MSRQAVLFGAFVLVALSTPQAFAQDPPPPIYWQGGAGVFTDANYTDGTTPNISQTGAETLYMGNGADITVNNSIGVARLRIGHTQSATGLTTHPGAGTVTVSGPAASLTTTLGASGAANAGIVVGNNQTGVLNIDDSAFVTSNRLVVVGSGNNVNRTGTLNITNGGFLSILDGNLNIADGINNQNGNKGFVNISGTTSSIIIAGNGADLVLAPRDAVATYTQTDGLVTVADHVIVGPESGGSTGSTFNISGGTLTTGTTNNGNFWVGQGSTIDPVVNISGTATINVGNRYLMGGGVPNVNSPPAVLATGAITNHSGGTLNIDVDLRVADTYFVGTSEATYNLSGTGVINTNTTALTSATNTVIGRQGIGRFIQTGGEANFNSPLLIGNREGATRTTANGLYKISAGDLNINAPASTFTTSPFALSIAANGTGEFRVVGDDATIDVTGDFTITSTENGNGTLAFELEPGDLLSQINITGNATFNAGSILTLDLSNASPTQMTYDVLTATSIVDDGIIFGGPSHWSYQIVPGGNGQILQLIQTGEPGLDGDHNQDGHVDAADYVAWRKLNISGPQGYEDFSENFGEGASGAGGAGQVPEPAALGLVGLALLGAAARWRGSFRA